MLLGRKKYLFGLISIAFIALILMIVGTIYDQQISNKIVENESIFGIIFTIIGQIPALTIAIFFASYLLFLPNIKNKKVFILVKAFAILSILLITVCEYDSGKDYAESSIFTISETLLKILDLLFVVLLNTAVVILTYFFKDRFDREKTICYAVLVLCIVYIVAGGTECIKYLFSRPRPWLVHQNVEGFREWYQLRPLYALTTNHDSKSFISGHASNSCCLLSVFPIFISLTSFQEKKYAFVVSFCVSLMFTTATTVSRLVIGAHYLTDLAGGLLCSTIVQIVVLFVIPLIIEKINEKLKTNSNS